MGSTKIMIIDYGMGNVGSVASALEYLGVNYLFSSRKEDLGSADALIMPGVGAFPAAMNNLDKLGIVNELNKQVLGKKKPFLGICLGMQLLAKDSVEQGFSHGLGWIDGHVCLINPQYNLRIPHVGWNNTRFDREHVLFKRIEMDSHFYYDHGYHIQCDKEWVVATCEYGGELVAAINKDNIFATQFHPEKSQRNGLKMLRNFINSVEKR